MFKSKKELAQALIEGRKFKTRENTVLVYNEDKNPPFWCEYPTSGGSGLQGLWTDYDKVEEIVEPKWYENIPEKGVLCWVSDLRVEEKCNIARIINYDNVDMVFTEDTCSWVYATPLTKEEALELVHE